MGLVLSVSRAHPLTRSEEDLLRDIVLNGANLSRLAFSGGPGAPPREATEALTRFLYRRWVLETLLVLLEGPGGFNEVQRAVGRPAGQSLAPKLQSLVEGGLVDREDLGGRPTRVRYTLTSGGVAVARAVFALTHGKVEHMRALAAPADGLPPPTAPPVAAGFRSFPDAAEAYEALTAEFVEARASVEPPKGAESPFVTARRFTEACTRKWHGAVLSTLAEGPRRFVDLRHGLGVGDQALANALAGLEALRSVERAPDGAYRITPHGLYDLSLGGAAVAVAARHRAAVLHAV